MKNTTPLAVPTTADLVGRLGVLVSDEAPRLFAVASARGSEDMTIAGYGVELADRVHVVSFDDAEELVTDDVDGARTFYARCAGHEDGTVYVLRPPAGRVQDAWVVDGPGIPCSQRTSGRPAPSIN